MLIFAGLWALVPTTYPVPAVAQSVPMIHRWQIDPDLKSQWTFDFWAQPRPVDTSGIQSDSLETLVRTAQTTSFQSRAGVINRQEVFEAAVQQLQSPQRNYQARLALVSAAVNLVSNTQEAESVWRAVVEEPEIRKIVEPVLMEWESDVAIEVWRKRVAEGHAGLGAFRYSELLTALDGLAVVGTPADREPLQSLLLRRGTPLPIQLAAARALGAVTAEGLETVAEQVLTSDQPHAYLLAANLLANHSGPQAEALMERVLATSYYPAQIVSYQAMAQANPERARELAHEYIKHPDNNMRLAAVHVLNQYDDGASLNAQATGIDDENPDIRNQVRANLELKASISELRPLVDEVITYQLAGNVWQGAEQAITLAVALNETERIPRFLDLLDHPQPHVFIRAAWGLQMLELSPETLEQILQRCSPVTQKLVDEKYVKFEEIAQTAFLFEALGRHAYKPADEMFRLYVPKNDYKMIGLTRAAAIYALGYIWQDTGNQRLAKQLATRMLDDNPLMPEDDLVRYNSAIALGRIKDPARVAELKQIDPSPGLPLPDAATWSLEQLQQPE